MEIEPPVDAHMHLGIAHRVLLPVFGPLAIRSMFDEMHVSDIYSD